MNEEAVAPKKKSQTERRRLSTIRLAALIGRRISLMPPQASLHQAEPV